MYAGPLKLMKKYAFKLIKVIFKIFTSLRNNLNKLKPSAIGKLTLTFLKGSYFIVEF